MGLKTFWNTLKNTTCTWVTWYFSWKVSLMFSNCLWTFSTWFNCSDNGKEYVNQFFFQISWRQNTPKLNGVAKRNSLHLLFFMFLRVLFGGSCVWHDLPNSILIYQHLVLHCSMSIWYGLVSVTIWCNYLCFIDLYLHVRNVHTLHELSRYCSSI